MNQEQNNIPSQEPPTDRQESHLHWMAVGRKLLLIALAAAVLLCLYYFRGDIKDAWDHYQAERALSQSNSSTRIYFDADSSNLYALLGSNLAVLGQTSFTVYNASGGIQLDTQLINNRPALAVSGELAAIYGRGGNTITIADLNSIRTTITTSGDLTDVTMNEAGYLAAVHTEDRYRSVVSVYNPKQALIYEWKTSDYYVLTAAVSSDGSMMAAVALTQENARFRMAIVIFQTNLDQRYATYEADDTLAYNLYFLDNDTLCAVGDDQALILSAEGELIRSYAYGTDTLSACDASGGTCVLALSDSNSGMTTHLVSLSRDQDPIVQETGEIRDLSVQGDYVAVLYTDTVELRRTDLTSVSEPVTIYNVRELYCTAQGEILLIYNSEAGFVDFVTPFS